MEPFTFVHAADLHLDSPFRGLSQTQPEMALRLQMASHAAFDNLLDLCRKNGAHALLLAGDIYDGADFSLRTQLRLRDGLSALADDGIHSLVVHGNHDPPSNRLQDLRWPTRCHFYSADKPTSHRIEPPDAPPALIWGVSHQSAAETRNLAKMFRRAAGEEIQIGLLHCNVGSGSGHKPYAPCSLADLLAAAMDYWALGHVHTRKILHRYPHIAYPGNIQGRHFKEPGARGCFVVRIWERGRMEVGFHALDTLRWEEVRIDLSGQTHLDDALQLMRDAVNGALQNTDGRDLVVRVILSGKTSLAAKLASKPVLHGLLLQLRRHFAAAKPWVWIQEIRTQGLALPLDPRAFSHGLPAAIDRQKQQLLAQLAAGQFDGHAQLAPLFQMLATANIRGFPQAKELQELLDQAASNLLTMLVE